MKWPLIAFGVALVLFGFVKLYQYVSNTQELVCGGMAAIECPSGFKCKVPNGGYADEPGKCSLF